MCAVKTGRAFTLVNGPEPRPSNSAPPAAHASRSERRADAHSHPRHLSVLPRLAGTCRNRTDQPPCDGLTSFEDWASHQTRTLPCATKSVFRVRRESLVALALLFGDDELGRGDHR